MFRKTFFTSLILFVGLQFTAVAAEALKCAICGMEFKRNAKTAFESTRGGNPTHFCSFACVHRFHEKFKDTPIFARDFETGNRIDASRAFFLFKSKNVLKELEFDMPPSVVAFSTEEAAKRIQSRLKDGEIVTGYVSLERAYR